MAAAVFLGSASKLLLVVHALVAMALLGASTHNAVICVVHLRGDTSWRRALQRKYLRIIVALYPATMLIGALAYPAYRVNARPGIDKAASLVGKLFEVKEHWAALAIGLLIAYVPLALRADKRARDKQQEPGAESRLCQLLGIGFGAMMWCLAITGLLAVSYKSI